MPSSKTPISNLLNDNFGYVLDFYVFYMLC
jgi:hypothetical protein